MTGKIYFLANIYTLKHDLGCFFLLVSSLHLNFAPVPRTESRLWAHFAACAFWMKQALAPLCTMEQLSRYIKPKVGAYAY